MSGNTINVQGSYIDIHDNENVYLSVDKAEVRMGQTAQDEGAGCEARGTRCEGLMDDSAFGELENELQEPAADVDNRVRRAVEILQTEHLLKHRYDYTWVMEVMNNTDGLPDFDSAQSFLTYLAGLGFEGLPGESSIKKELSRMWGVFPNWTFPDKDTTESMRRINVAKRFLSAFRKGG